MSLEAALQALTDEAAEWDDTSRALSDAAGTVADLHLSTAQFSFISYMTGVDASYARARDHVESVLRAGTRETTELAGALRKVRDDYRSTDEKVAADVRAVWILDS